MADRLPIEWVGWDKSSIGKASICRVKIASAKASSWRRITSEDVARLLAMLELTRSSEDNKNSPTDMNAVTALAARMTDHFGINLLKRLALRID